MCESEGSRRTKCSTSSALMTTSTHHHHHHHHKESAINIQMKPNSQCCTGLLQHLCMCVCACAGAGVCVCLSVCVMRSITPVLSHSSQNPHTHTHTKTHTQTHTQPHLLRVCLCDLLFSTHILQSHSLALSSRPPPTRRLVFAAYFLGVGLITSGWLRTPGGQPRGLSDTPLPLLYLKWI